MTPGVEQRMLAQPSWIVDMSRDQIEGLLTLTAKIDYNREKHGEIWAELSEIGQSFPDLPWSTTGYFVRMSSCGFKDLDDRFLKASYGMRGAMLKLVHSRATIHALPNLLDCEDFVLDNKLYVFLYILKPRSAERVAVLHSQRSPCCCEPDSILQSASPGNIRRRSRGDGPPNSFTMGQCQVGIESNVLCP